MASRRQPCDYPNHLYAQLFNNMRIKLMASKQKAGMLNVLENRRWTPVPTLYKLRKQSGIDRYIVTELHISSAKLVFN